MQLEIGQRGICLSMVAKVAKATRFASGWYNNREAKHIMFFKWALLCKLPRETLEEATAIRLQVPTSVQIAW